MKSGSPHAVSGREAEQSYDAAARTADAAATPVDPAAYYFRCTPVFQTAAPVHQWLGRTVFVASGARHPDRVEIDVFAVG